MRGVRYLSVIACAWGCANGAAATQGDDTTPPPDVSDAAGSTGDVVVGDASPAIDSGSSSDTSTPGATKAAAGDVLISEVMYNPTGTEPTSEWIEIANIASGPKNIGGLTLKDGAGRTHVIAGSLVVPAGAFVVLARTKAAAATAKIPAAAVVYEYGAGLAVTDGIILANGTTGSIALLDGTTVLVQTDYGTFTVAGSGKSIQLKTLTVAASTKSASWCVSATAWAAGADMGTPGAAPNCP